MRLAGLFDVQGALAAAGPWGLVAVAAVIFAETGLLLGFFLPGDTLLFFAGVLLASGVIAQPLWLVVLVLGAAAVAGAQVGYLIGHRFGPAVFARREEGVFSRQAIARTERFFRRFGWASILLARFVPVVRTFAPVAAGIGRMRLVRFTLWNVIGAFAWVTVMLLVGVTLGSIPGVASFVSTYVDLILLAIVVLSVAPPLLRALLKRRAARRES